MTKTSIIDKLNIILEVSKSSKLFIAVLVFIILLAVFAITMNKKNEKNTKTIYMLVYAFIIIAILVGYSSSLGKMFDYMMNNFFIAIYFPNLAIYLAALITANIIFLVSIFNKRISKLIKNINVIIFSIMAYVLTLILNIINTENLDVFSQSSVYGNTQAQALIELSSTIFMLWMAFLIIYKMIRTYQIKMEPEYEKSSVKKVVVEKKTRVLPANIREVKALDSIELGAKEVVVEKKTRVLPANISEVKSPRYIKQLPTKQVAQPPRILPPNIKEIKPLAFATIETKTNVVEKEVVVEKKVRVLPENIKEIKSPRYVKQLPSKVETTLQPVKPQVKPQLKPAMTTQEIDMLLAPAYDQMFSLDDYKRMRNMLVEKQKRQQEKYERQQNEQFKFQQLKDLYEA